MNPSIPKQEKNPSVNTTVCVYTMFQALWQALDICCCTQCPQQSHEVYNSINPILQMKKLRLRDLCDIPKVTQLVSGETGARTEVPKLQNLCI